MDKQKKKNGSLVVIVLFCVYLLLPLFLTFLYSVFTQWTSLVPQGFTLQFYVQLFTSEGFLLPLLRTVIISIVPVVLMGRAQGPSAG